MNDRPLVSVIVPLYNKEQWIKRCINSIMDQSYQNMEILVINDGSTDESVAIVKAVKEKRIRIIDKPNGGVSSARNLGLDHAKGEYVTFLDADDEWNPEHIALILKGFVENPDAVMVANQYVRKFAKEQKNEQRPDHDDSNDMPIHYKAVDHLKALSKGEFPFHIGSMMCRRSMLEQNDIRFYEHINMGEDMNVLIRITQQGESLLSEYEGMVYYQDDQNSAMSQKQAVAQLVPEYFYGMEQQKWSQAEYRMIIRFLHREYFKKAYQNRRLPLRNEELKRKMSGGVKIGMWVIPIYLMIRYTPEFIYTLYRTMKRFVK